jgi:hypothetical protein
MNPFHIESTLILIRLSEVLRQAVKPSGCLAPGYKVRGDHKSFQSLPNTVIVLYPRRAEIFVTLASWWNLGRSERIDQD